jgi:hypothetical protein
MSILGTLLADATLQMHRQVGKVYSGTLRVRTTPTTFASVTWGAYYLEPISEHSAIGGGGVEPRRGMFHLYKRGETSDPRPDDQFIDKDSKTWLFQSVGGPRLDADAGIAIFDCEAVRV